MSSFLSFIILSILFNTRKTMACPSSYNPILNGCYKINNNSNMTWSNARQYCINDLNTTGTNTAGSITHLIALESAMETTALTYWMKAWSIQTQFWTDGVAATSSWDWSNQTITWYFNLSDQIIYGNGSNYRLVYNTSDSTYEIGDATNNTLLHFICEYQELCATNNSCQNNAQCYLNIGQQLCVCAPGYTGSTCDLLIDECLSSPCLHGGECTPGINSYTCNCSNTYYDGQNCETPQYDPTESQRSAAFWSVFGVVCGLVVLLTLSDLPWDEIATTIGCPWFRYKCCSHRNDEDDEDINMQRPQSAASTTNENNFLTIPDTSARGMNYHIMNTVWNPEQVPNATPSNPQYDGYRTPDQRTAPSNVLIQSYAEAAMGKQKEKEIENKRVYAVDIVKDNNASGKTKNPADTMISWTHQLQEQLKTNQQNRPTSASSTKQLIESEKSNN